MSGFYQYLRGFTVPRSSIILVKEAATLHCRRRCRGKLPALSQISASASAADSPRNPLDWKATDIASGRAIIAHQLFGQRRRCGVDIMAVRSGLVGIPTSPPDCGEDPNRAGVICRRFGQGLSEATTLHRDHQCRPAPLDGLLTDRSGDIVRSTSQVSRCRASPGGARGLPLRPGDGRGARRRIDPQSAGLARDDDASAAEPKSCRRQTVTPSPSHPPPQP